MEEESPSEFVEEQIRLTSVLRRTGLCSFQKSFVVLSDKFGIQVGSLCSLVSLSFGVDALFVRHALQH